MQRADIRYKQFKKQTHMNTLTVTGKVRKSLCFVSETVQWIPLGFNQSAYFREPVVALLKREPDGRRDDYKIMLIEGQTGRWKKILTVKEYNQPTDQTTYESTLNSFKFIKRHIFLDAQFCITYICQQNFSITNK